VVVATTLVTEARSNKVAGATAADAVSYVKRPKALRAMRRSSWVTATQAAGKTCSSIASRRMEKAEGNCSLCWSKAETRVGAARFRVLTLVMISLSVRVIAELVGSVKRQSYGGIKFYYLSLLSHSGPFV
jgi:hypothetical protein